MSNKGKVLSILGIGLIVCAVTWVAFLVGYTNEQKDTLDYVALTFVLIAEVVLFSGLILILHYQDKMSKVLVTGGLISTLLLYWAGATIISLLSKTLFENNMGGFVTTQVFLCAVAAIILISLSVFASSMKVKDNRIINSGVILQESENRLFLLKTDTQYDDFAECLNKLYEELKFSDKTMSLASKEQEINTNIIELCHELKTNKNNISKQEIDAKVNDIILLIKGRNMSVKQAKQGGF